MSFSVDLSRAISNVEKIGLDIPWRTSVAMAFNQVVAMTPVDTGQAAASWLMGKSNGGGVGDSRLDIKASDIPPVGGVYMLYSNLPYIERLEDGYSEKALNGMVKVVVSRWPAILASNIK